MRACVVSLLLAALFLASPLPAAAQTGAEPRSAARPASGKALDLPPEEEVLQLFEEKRPYTVVPEKVFKQLGPELPDGGATVKALADDAPGGAFDPRKLEALPAEKLGYKAKWHE